MTPCRYKKALRGRLLHFSILLAVPSCFNSFWHGVIPTSYFIFNNFLCRLSLECNIVARGEMITRICTSVKIIKIEIRCRDDTVPKTVDTRSHCKVWLRACNNLPQPPKKRDVGRGLRKIVACSQPYLAVASCICSFWHGVIPTSYFIFNDFYTCFTHFSLTVAYPQHRGLPSLAVDIYPDIRISLTRTLYIIIRSCARYIYQRKYACAKSNS